MSQVKLEVILAAIDKATAPFKKVHQAANVLSKGVVEAKGKLKELEKQQALISEFDKLQSEFKQTSTSLDVAKKSFIQIGATMSQVKNPSQALRKEYAATKSEVERLNGVQQKQLDKLMRSRQALGAAGIDANNLAKAQKTLAINTTSTIAGITKQEAALKKLSDTQEKHSRLSDKYNKSMAARDKIAGMGAQTMGAGVAVGLPIVATVKSSMDFETSMLGVAKQVDGARTDAGKLTQVYYNVKAAIQQMSTEIPMAREELAALVEAQARSGIQGEKNLITMAKVSAMASTAFDLPAEQVGEDIGRIAGLYKIPISEIEKLGDMMNWLDDNTRSKGGDIIEVMTRMGDVADVLGAKNAAALGSTFLSLGSEPEKAASAARAMVRELSVANMQSARFKIGVEMIGGNVSQIQKEMSEDAMGTITKIITALNKVPKENRMEAATRLFGKEYGKDALKLANNTAELEKQLALTQDIKAVGSMGREMSARKDTGAAQMEMLGNDYANVMSDAGDLLRSDVLKIISAFSGVLQATKVWMKENPVLVSTILRVVAVIAILLTVVGGLMLAVAAFMTPLIIMRHGIGLLGLKFGWFSGMIGGVGKAFMWLGRAFLMNPIGLAITAIIVAAVLLYTHWETVKNAIVAGWQWIDSVFADNPILNALFPIIGVARLVINHWETVKVHLGATWAAIKAIAVAAWDGLIWYVSNISPLAPIIQNWDAIMVFLRGLKDKMVEIGKHIIEGLISGVKGELGKLKAMWDGVNNMMPDMFRKKLEVRSPSRVMARLGGYVMEGLGRGVTRGRGMLANTFDRSIDFLTEPLGVPAFPVPSFASGGVNGGEPVGRSGGGKGGAGGQPSNVTYQININGVGGGANGAQDIAREVEQAIRKLEAERASRSRSSFMDKD